MRILCAEDDEQLGKLLVAMLKREGMDVVWVQDGQSAYESAYDDKFDIIVLDWMMPKMDGVEVCAKLRREDYQGKILMLTAKDSISDKVAGFTSGADDYLVKPFEFAELVARLQALARRGELFQNDKLTYGKLTLNRTEKTLSCEGSVLQLGSREFDLLDLLFTNPGQVIPRGTLMDRVWGVAGDVTENNLDAHIKMLRKKLALLPAGITIKTVRGVGYKLGE